MPWTGGCPQVKALFAKDPKLAARWVRKYGNPCKKKESKR
jgi:hypothetical protein